MAIVIKDINYAEKKLKDIRAAWPEFVLRYEEEIYFNHYSEVERGVAAIAYAGFKFCPMCGLPLNTKWLLHTCEVRTNE